MEKLLNLIFIPNCIFCKSQGSFFCDKCLSSCTKFVVKLVKHPKFFAHFLFVYEYERFIRECIRSSKYKNKHFAALKVLTEKTTKNLQVSDCLCSFINGSNCVVVPIPVSKAKLKLRGFNQAEIIANKLATQMSVPLRLDLLVRNKETVAQFTKNRSERFINMQKAFVVKSRQNLGEMKVILVDDVCTTGATFIEAAKTLKQAGVKEVLCFALARKSLEIKGK